MSSTWGLVPLALSIAAPSGAVAMNLYEWLAVAPIVAAVEVRTEDSRHVEAEVTRSLRGALVPGQRILVDLRKANRDREMDRRSLWMVKGGSYLMLLRPTSNPKKPDPPLYELVRGVEGVRAPPVESAEAWLDAASRLVEIQDTKDDAAIWRAMAGFLEGTNPVLLDNALDLFLKFRRGTGALLSSLRPLLDHPRPDVRARVAELVGQILGRKDAPEAPDLAPLIAELIARARRDPSVRVRVASTITLGSIRDAGTEEALREIATDDPDQSVRYEAERLLYEWRQGGRR